MSHGIAFVFVLPFYDNDLIVNSVIASWHHLDNSSLGVGRKHDCVLGEKLILINMTNDITMSQQIARAEISGSPVPSLVSVKTRHLDASGNITTLGHLLDLLKRTLNTIEDVVNDSWTQFN